MIARGTIAAIALALAAPSLADTKTRISAFEYDPVSGQLTKEIIEPPRTIEDPANASNYYQFCLATTYQYDTYGNRTGAITRNCNGSTSNEAPAPTGDPVFAPGTSTSAFIAGSIAIGGTTYNWSAGQFATSSTNALFQAESRVFDPRFGSAAGLTGPNGLTTTWTYDGFGRKTSETRADGTVTSWFYERCVDLGAACPSPNGQYRVRVTTTGAPTSSTYFDSLNRAIRIETQGFDGTLVLKDTQFDALGRVVKVSQPFIAGSAPVWTTFTPDILRRVTRVDEPTVNGLSARTVTDYNGLVTTVTVSNAGVGTAMPGAAAQIKITTRNSQGQVIKVDRQ